MWFGTNKCTPGSSSTTHFVLTLKIRTNQVKTTILIERPYDSLYPCPVSAICKYQLYFCLCLFKFTRSLQSTVHHQQWYEANVGPRWVQTIQFVCRLSQAIADGKVMVKQEFLVVVEVRRAVFSHQIVCGVAIVASL